MYYYSGGNFEKLNYGPEETFRIMPGQKPALFPSESDEEGNVYLLQPGGSFMPSQITGAKAGLYYYDGSDFDRVLGPDDPDEAILKFSAQGRPEIVPICEEEEEEEEDEEREEEEEEEEEEEDDDEDGDGSSWLEENRILVAGIIGVIILLIIIMLISS